MSKNRKKTGKNPKTANIWEPLTFRGEGGGKYRKFRRFVNVFRRQKPQGRVKGIEMQQAQDIMGMLRVNPKAKPKPQPKLPQKRKRKQKDAEPSDDEFLFSDDDSFESPKKKRRYKQESDSDFEPDAPPVKRSRKRKTESSGEDLLPKKRRRT